MEFCTTRAMATLPIQNGRVAAIQTHLRFSHFLLLNKTLSSLTRRRRGLHSRISFTGLRPRASSSDDISSGSGPYSEERRNGVITLDSSSPSDKNVYSETVRSEIPEEESVEEEQTQSLEFIDKLNLDPNDAYSILLLGGSALVALWLASAVVGSIDSIPVFPKLMEVVGLAYTFWFTSRYLIFKENRDEFGAKIEELKKQVLGSDDS